MSLKMRKIYLHLNDDTNPVSSCLISISPRDMANNASHAIEFRSGNLYTRVWVNIFDMELRRDLIGVYLTDLRRVKMRDKVICTNSSRDRVSRKRPGVTVCIWRTLEDEY